MEHIKLLKIKQPGKVVGDIITLEVKVMREEVERVLGRVRPALQADGGDVELVDVDGGIVKVRLTGACGGCPMASLTLKNGIEAALKEEIPSVERVESV